MDAIGAYCLIQMKIIRWHFPLSLIVENLFFEDCNVGSTLGQLDVGHFNSGIIALVANCLPVYSLHKSMDPRALW